MGGGINTPSQKKLSGRVKTNNDLPNCLKFLMVLKDVNPTILWGGGRGRSITPHIPIFKSKINQADHFRPKSCFISF